MRYPLLLAALAALQPVTLGLPAGASGEAEAVGVDGPGRSPSSSASVDTASQPGRAEGSVEASFSGDADLIGLKLELSADEAAQKVADGAQAAGLPQEVADQLSREARQRGGVASADDMAALVGTVGKMAADVSGGSGNATQAASVLGSIKGVVQSALGNNTASNVVIGACMVAATSGETLEVVIKVTMETVKALQEAARAAPGAAQSPQAALDNLSIDAAAVRSAAEQSCESGICRASVGSVIELASAGINHDVLATFVVSVEALGKFKSVDVKVETDLALRDFASKAAQGIEQLGSDTDGQAAAAKIGQISQTLQLSSDEVQEITSEAQAAASEAQKLPDLQVPAPNRPSSSATASADSAVAAVSAGSREGRIWAERDNVAEFSECLRRMPDNPCVRELFHLQGSLGRFRTNCQTGDLSSPDRGFVFRTRRHIETLFPPQLFPEGPKCGLVQQDSLQLRGQDFRPVCEQCILN